MLTLSQAGVLALRFQNKAMLAVENPGNPDVSLPAKLSIDVKRKDLRVKHHPFVHFDYVYLRGDLRRSG